MTPSVGTLLGVGAAPAAAGGGPFSPPDIAGLETWLKADFITGLSDGDPVTTWEDAHTSNKDGTQGTSAAKPTYKTSIVNSLPVVRFDGTDDFMSIALTPNDATRTVFVVAKQATDTTGRRVWSLEGGGNDAELTVENSIWKWFANEGGTTTSLGGRPVDWSIVTVKFNSTSSADGYVTGTATNFNPADGYQAAGGLGLRIGSGQGAFFERDFWNGDIAEFLMYDSALSDTDREAVERYLRVKYALPAILRPNADVTHNWAITNGGATQGWQVIDDVMVQPAAPGTGSDYIRNDASAEVEEVALTTATVGTVTEAKVWYYASSGTIATATTIALYKGGTQIASGTMAGNSSAAWRSVTYTGSLTQGEVDDLRIRFTAPVTDVATIYAAYVELTHTS